MSRRKQHIPFTGEPPVYEPGDLVEVRTAEGDWVRRVALDHPRYDDANAIGRNVYLTVPIRVGDPDAWLASGHKTDWINWPAEDVRAISSPGSAS